MNNLPIRFSYRVSYLFSMTAAILTGNSHQDWQGDTCRIAVMSESPWM